MSSASGDHWDQATGLLRLGIVMADRSTNSGEIDSRALLLGLLELTGGSAARALKGAGLVPDAEGKDMEMDKPLLRSRRMSRSARDAFAAAGKHADALHDPLLRTGHLLLALLDQRFSSAGFSLAGQPRQRLREHVLELLAEDRARGDNEDIRAMELTISDELLIPFLPDLVWSLLAPIENVVLFLPEGHHVHGAQRLAGAGGTPDQEQYLLRTEGRDVLYASEIVEEVPGRRAVIRDVAPLSGYESRVTEWELSPSGAGTLLIGRLTLRVIAPVRSMVQQAEAFHRAWLHNHLRRVGELLAEGWRPE